MLSLAKRLCYTQQLDIKHKKSNEKNTSWVVNALQTQPLEAKQSKAKQIKGNMNSTMAY
jgi:hypothetical protein